MYWVIQENIYGEEGLTNLINLLKKIGQLYIEIKVVPFIGDVIPDINPLGDVICIGSYALRNIAKRKSWFPGVYDIEYFNYKNLIEKYQENVLNYNCIFGRFGKIKPEFDKFFIRPIHDSKNFNGRIETKESFKLWQTNVIKLGKNDGWNTLDKNTEVLYVRPKKIYNETRFWIIGNKISTYSQYKIGNKVLYENYSSSDQINFVKKMLDIYCLDIPFVMDICETPDGFKIIEFNTLNSSGLYAGNVYNIVEDIILYNEKIRNKKERKF